ncbi:uncharacterized protein HMPREF1541_08061 [Cyphellophora europaea CBS 101466]|uniref:O-acyltransferase WSD1 C-terminal domain-containing protein n=1 Tax=Cyphellophora europaea (strain CBS 101466) TaxID=1220924 RepID=W2RKQ9_CYPE1|nr:uncharacterized protein HMPREF1541_08061 [Cyphellophora europaea CBS 101466]ETN37071.1 hypothetical protein HMPREF1541_08061 [Cyphellophora europaea CBS 101466]
MDPREPSLNERRCIIRHDLGFYHGLAASVVYNVPGPQITDLETLAQKFGPALQHCVEQHPILGLVIDKADTEQPTFRRLSQLHLGSHLILTWPGEVMVGRLEENDEHVVAERAMERVVNARFQDVGEAPPWRLFVIPLQSDESAHLERSRALVVFNYSHSHGDGISGLAFHHSLLQALVDNSPSRNEAASMTTRQTGTKQIPPSPDPMPISWSYMLGVLANEFLPGLPRLLFWRGTVAPPWTANRAVFNAHHFRTGSKLLIIDGSILKLALARCRQNGIKMSALLHLLVVRSLTTTLRENGIDPASFVSGTPIDLRKHFALTAMDMSMNPSTVSYQHNTVTTSQPISDPELCSAREMTAKFAQASSTIQDQIIGLLKYASPMRKWFLDKLGKPRSTSYELSNIGSFKPTRSAIVHVDHVYFSQPADAVGHPLSVNVVSLDGGDLSIMLSWQIGALDLEGTIEKLEETERGFIDGLAASIKADFVHWATPSER